MDLTGFLSSGPYCIHGALVDLSGLLSSSPYLLIELSAHGTQIWILRLCQMSLHLANPGQQLYGAEEVAEEAEFELLDEGVHRAVVRLERGEEFIPVELDEGSHDDVACAPTEASPAPISSSERM